VIVVLVKAASRVLPNEDGASITTDERRDKLAKDLISIPKRFALCFKK